MIVKEFDIDNLPKENHEGKRMGWGLVPQIVKAFINSNNDCVELIDDEGIYSNSNNMRKAFKGYILRTGIKNVNAVIRGNRVFLIWGNGNEM